jgi:DNA-binding SARP family transcriptional activator/Tfp pilus assembly protein PilF
MSQDELAARAGVSLRAIRDIEHGRVRRPRSGSVDRLAAALQLSDHERDDLSAVLAVADPADQRPRIGVLGPLSVWRGGSALDLGTPMRRRLLGLLALHPRQVLPRDEIVDALWGEQPPKTCAALIRVYIGQLRALLDPGRPKRTSGPTIVLAHGGYRLDIGDDQLDLARFDGLVARARQSRATGEPAAAMESLEAALRCWRGPVLADVAPSLRHHPAALAATRRRLVATLAYADLALELGEPQRAIGQLRASIVLEPLHEGLHARLVLALARSGEQAAALQLYAEIRERLRVELGTDPGEELQAAHVRVLRREVSTRAEPAGPATTGPAQVPAQLPAGTAAFTGRRPQLRLLDAAAGLAVISGIPGVGKTALAVHWAQRVRDRFPGGQLYIDLRGYATTPPVRPIQALTSFLRALGAPPDRIPTDVDDAVGLYRSLLADRQLLVVLDNAHDVDQVRPLLPGGDRCLALVTSRNRLGGLVAVEGAHRIRLETLTAPEGRSLLRRVLDRERVSGEPDAVAALVAACDGLPLALRVAAANLADEPRQSIADYVDLLAAGRIAALRVDGDDRAAVGAAFALSYRRLDPGAGRLFRLLGLDPGGDITTEAAAALAGGTGPEARRLLHALTDAHLVEQSARDRYSCHDLIRRYARDLAHSEDSEADRRAAVARLCEYYVSTVDAAADVLYPHVLRLPRPPSRPLWLGASDAAQRPGAVADRAGFADPDQALAWLDAERANLVATVGHAAAHGPHAMAWLLADGLRGYFANRVQAIDWLTTARAGLAAAEDEDDAQAMASARLSLGLLNWRQGHHHQAIGHYTAALTHARHAGWAEGQAAVLGNLGAAWTELGDVDAGVRHFAAALDLHRRTGRLVGQAAALSNLGTTYLELGRLAEAIEHLEQALDVYQRLGSPAGEAISRTNLGETYQQAGRRDDALAQLTLALTLHREAGNRGNEADTLAVLAAVHLDAGRAVEALELAGAALTVARDCGHRLYEAVALNALASVHSVLGRRDQALAHHGRARQLAGEVGNRYAETTALLGLATVHRDLAQPDQARACATEALSLARAAGYGILERKARAVLG